MRVYMDRRSGEDRRKFNDRDYKGPEQRNGINRRSGEDRRKRKSYNHSRPDKYPQPLLLEQELQAKNAYVHNDRDLWPSNPSANVRILS